MRNYDLTIEDGVITHIEDCDSDYNTIPGILYIPKEATYFSTDAWDPLGGDIDGIVVHIAIHGNSQDQWWRAASAGQSSARRSAYSKYAL